MSTVNLSKQTVNLTKGERINLSKSSEGLKKILVGLGWDPADENGYRTESVLVQPGFIGKLFGAKDKVVERTVRTGSNETIDCDAWLALLSGGRLLNNMDIVYYGRKEYYNDSELVVLHHGDNLTGEGEGDDEQITINLDKLPDKYDSIVVGVTIYQGKSKGQSFDNIKNTFIRIVDEKDNFEICRFNQAEMAEDKGSITFIAGKLYKDKGEWQFTAVGKGTKDASIGDAANHYRY
ncbi:MAG: TerD family protein [Lachnospiraceae bacterium]|nr:TerD family protein [Lachnospiraceae bacterium]